MLPTNDAIKQSEYMAFVEAISGQRGDLDAWLECNDEAEVRAMILHHVSARERAAYERAAQQCEIVRHNSPLTLSYQDGCSDCANSIRALGADK